jgi:hypothetical protein
MHWFIWALLSAFFARATAVLAKIGVKEINSNLATAIRTVVILVFAWGVAMFTHTQPLSAISRRTWIFLILSGLATGLSWLCYFRTLQRGEASRVGRQAQRGRGHGAGCNFSARTTHLAPLGRGTIHFLRCGGGGVCIVRDARFVDLQILRRGDLSCAGALG